MAKRFGFWRNWAEWREFLERTNEEFARCLQRDGRLFYKILDGRGNGTTKLRDLGRLTNFVLIKDQAQPSRGINRSSSVHFLTYAPRPFLAGE